VGVTINLITSHYNRKIKWESLEYKPREYVMIQVFNLKGDPQLSSEYFMSDAICNGSAGMTLYYYMCRSWQDCFKKGENRSWPSVSVESVDSECWYLNNTILCFNNAVNSGRTCIYFVNLF
jgi:hypothetical protein